MGWKINNVANEPRFTKEQAEKLAAALWEKVEHVYSEEEALDELFTGPDDDGLYFLHFDPDHMEHMDWLTGWDNLVEIVAGEYVTGDVAFSSIEGDNKGQPWGVRFDGTGKYMRIVGKTKWNAK